MVNLKEDKPKGGKDKTMARRPRAKGLWSPTEFPTCCDSTGCRKAKVLHKYFSSVLGEEPNDKLYHIMVMIKYFPLRL